MNEIGEAVGGIVEGGLVARAVEPRTGDHGHTHEGACLNCGTALVGAHCHACGQRAHVHRTLGAFFHDLLHGVLHFEGKTWRTLPMLAFKPGQLTREYIEGKRARYISPVALFLFVVFVSFALWNALGGLGQVDENVTAPSREQFETSVTSLDTRIAGLEEDLGEARQSGEDEATIARYEEELAGARKARELTSGLLEGAVADDAGDEAIQVTDSATGSSLTAYLNAAVKKVKANPNLTIYKLQTNSYKLSWLLIPLSLPFMWLLFPFSRCFRMYDHTVFVTYSIAFMTILVLISSLGSMTGFTPLIIAPALYAPVHLYWQLRGTYGLTRGGAFWRLIVLSILIWVVLLLFAIIMLGMVIG